VALRATDARVVAYPREVTLGSLAISRALPIKGGGGVQRPAVERNEPGPLRSPEPFQLILSRSEVTNMSTYDVSHDTRVIVRGAGPGFAQAISAGRHRFFADEPIPNGGTDTGPTPYDLLLAALGS
jgi:hypothetical protein